MKAQFLSLILLCFLVYPSFGQLDNSSFYEENYFVSDSNFRLQSYKSKLDFEVDYFGFFRNREFFSNIADGYTLFGNQFLGKLKYSLDTTFQFSVGFFLRKDFGSQLGNSRFEQIQPYFQFLYQKRGHQIIFGNLEGNLQHGLIEPLFNFENIINRRLENGLQYRYNSQKTKFDTWVDWVTMIYPYSDFDEELNVGIALERSLLASHQNKTWKTSLPIQFTAIHRGGQINTTDNPLLTIFNAAIGNKTTYFFPKKAISKWSLKYIQSEVYGVFFLDNSTSTSFPFEEGTGIYANLELATPKHQLMLSYWRGQDFVAPLGGDIYSSVSRIFDENTQNESLRNLIILRFLTNFDLLETKRGRAKLVFRATPFYNLENQKFNFSTGLYAMFNTDFLLKKWERIIQVLKNQGTKN